MKEAEARELFARLAKRNPRPTTELQYTSTFELLIAVILSAQATDLSVNRATRVLFSHANTPQAILDLGEERLRQFIASIGLYRNKARNIIRTCEILLQKHAGEIPNQRAALEELPGVGRKTANVILNTAFGAKTIAVDTHVFRLANRTGLAVGKTVAEVERKLLKEVPAPYLQYAHHWLILHGRYVCKAAKPRCAECIIADLCAYRQAAKAQSHSN